MCRQVRRALMCSNTHHLTTTANSASPDTATIESGRSGRTRHLAPRSATRPPRLARPPSAPMMDARLRLVYEFLDSDLYENALFLAERLHVLDPDNSTWLHLTALCYLRLGRVSLALEHSRKGIKGAHLGCSYVFAQACLRQKNYVDGIAALRQAQPLWGSKHTPSWHLVECCFANLWYEL